MTTDKKPLYLEDIHGPLVLEGQDKAVALAEPKAPNEEGSTQCVVRWMLETPGGWLGAYDKSAFDAYRQQIIEELAQGSGVMPKLYYHDGESWCDSEETREAIASLEARNQELGMQVDCMPEMREEIIFLRQQLEQSEARVRELEKSLYNRAVFDGHATACAVTIGELRCNCGLAAMNKESGE